MVVVEKKNVLYSAQSLKNKHIVAIDPSSVAIHGAKANLYGKIYIEF
ncbi:MAG: hypothetical protein ACFFFH_10785 [Candidatus Thorarchaeota archaeon]